MDQKTVISNSNRTNNISRLLLFGFILIIAYLIYVIITLRPDTQTIEIPIVDITKQIEKIDNKVSDLEKNTTKIYNKVDSIKGEVVNNESKIINNYNNIKDEKSYLLNQNDSINLLFFNSYINQYKSTTNYTNNIK